jgi:hypothetical protein
VSVGCWFGVVRECADAYRNIGRFTTIAHGLDKGKHTIRCELLQETSDPGGGTEFRIISIMRYVWAVGDKRGADGACSV